MIFCTFSNFFSVEAVFDEGLQEMVDNDTVEGFVINEVSLKERLCAIILEANLSDFVECIETESVLEDKHLQEFCVNIAKHELVANATPNTARLRDLSRIVMLLENYGTYRLLIPMWKSQAGIEPGCGGYGSVC